MLLPETSPDWDAMYFFSSYLHCNLSFCRHVTILLCINKSFVFLERKYQVLLRTVQQYKLITLYCDKLIMIPHMITGEIIFFAG